MQRIFIMAMAITIVLLPACTSKKKEKYADLSEGGKQIMTLLDKIEKNDKLAYKAYKQGLTKLEVDNLSVEEIQKTTKQALAMQKRAEVYLVKSSKLLTKVSQLTREKKSSLTKKDKQAIDKRKAEMFMLNKKIGAINEKFPKAAERAAKILIKKTIQRMSRK
ncbi:hypothetical protein ACFL3T_01280 [Patescibacteria group bacterium]